MDKELLISKTWFRDDEERISELEIDLMVDLQGNKLLGIWYSGTLVEGTYLGEEFKVTLLDRQRELNLYDRSINKVIIDDNFDTKELKSVIEDTFNKLDLPIEDETVFAIENDIDGVNSVIGDIDLDDLFLIEIGNTKITTYDTLIPATVGAVVEIVGRTKGVIKDKRGLEFTCVSCLSNFKLEDYIQYAQAAGLVDIDRKSVLEDGLSCIDCGEEVLLFED